MSRTFCWNFPEASCEVSLLLEGLLVFDLLPRPKKWFCVCVEVIILGVKSSLSVLFRVLLEPFLVSAPGFYLYLNAPSDWFGANIAFGPLLLVRPSVSIITLPPDFSETIIWFSPGPLAVLGFSCRDVYRLFSSLFSDILAVFTSY